MSPVEIGVCIRAIRVIRFIRGQPTDKTDNADNADKPLLLPLSWSLVTCPDHRLYAATHIKISDDFAAKRIAGSHNVVKDLVGDVLVKNPLVAIRKDVQFQRLQFNDCGVGHVLDADRSKVWLSGSRAHGREFGTTDLHLVFASPVLIRKSLELI